MENNINYEAMSQDEIIFMGRNKSYGAYDLRQAYNEHIKRAIIGMVLFTTFTIGVQKLLSHPLVAKVDKAVVVDMTNVEIVTPPPTIPKPKTEPIQHGTPDAATTAALEMKPTEDKAVPTDTAVAIDPETAVSDHTQEGTKGETPGLPTGTGLGETAKAEIPKPSEPLNVAEYMPEFPGGENALMAYIREHTKYPEYEMEMGIQGKAVVGFVINEDGKVSDVKIMKSLSKGIDRESVRVIRSLPNFKPGRQNGRNVKVRYVVPMDFHQKD
jgi:protein TonB